jgi:nucleotide-binding universal stress UspA family protein
MNEPKSGPMDSKSNGVIWAVTPFDATTLRAQASAAAAIDMLYGETALIRPVCVWDTRIAELARAVDSMRELANVTFSKWKKPDLRGTLAGLHMVDARGGTTEQARILITYAKKVGASLIVASHQKRTGLKKWFQGSFCESLSLISDVPLLIVPPNWNGKRGSTSVLFPTDFSSASLSSFEEVLPVAEKMGLELTIYYRTEFPTFIGEEFLYTASREFALIEKKNLKENKIKMDEMAKRARALGIRVKTIFDKRRGGSAADAVLAQAKRGYSFIAMAAHNGGLGRILMGSTSRAVLQESPCPVWIVRTRSAS